MQLVGEDPLVKLGLGHEDRLPQLYHDSAKGRGELGIGHSAVEVILHNGVWFFSELESLMLVVAGVLGKADGDGKGLVTFSVIHKLYYGWHKELGVGEHAVGLLKDEAVLCCLKHVGDTYREALNWTRNSPRWSHSGWPLTRWSHTWRPWMRRWIRTWSAQRCSCWWWPCSRW